MSDSPEEDGPGKGGYRPGAGRIPGSKNGDGVPGVRSLFGTDEAPINEDGQQWRADNLKAVMDWAKDEEDEKTPLVRALDNLLALNKNPSAQRTIVEFLVGRPVIQSEVEHRTPTSVADAEKAMLAGLEAMKLGMIENGVDPEFAERLVQQSIWGDEAHEVAEDDDAEVFGEAL